MAIRVGDEGGFGLVELLIALTVMAIGISALVAGFSSGVTSINRASQASTAGTIADKEMEKYRALSYASIPTCSSPTAPAAGPCTTVATPPPVGADGRTYQMQVTVGFDCAQGTLDGTVAAPTCTGTSSLYPEKLVSKLVTVLVSNEDGSRDLLRQSSTFHASTG